MELFRAVEQQTLMANIVIGALDTELAAMVVAEGDDIGVAHIADVLMGFRGKVAIDLDAGERDADVLIGEVEQQMVEFGMQPRLAGEVRG
jgi:hypothetical protein